MQKCTFKCRLNASPKRVNPSQQVPGDWRWANSAQGSLSNTDLSQDEQMQENERNTEAGMDEITD